MALVGKRERLPWSRVFTWVLLLALGQLADLTTTQAAMSKGAVDGNVFAAGILAVGGLALLWMVKGTLVAAMAVSVVLVRRYWGGSRDWRAGLVRTLLWRGLQACVVVLSVTAVHNLAVMSGIAS